MNKPNNNQKPKTAITPMREDNFPEWYQEVIKAADMAENSPVRGCMIIKPYGYAIWENMQRIFDATIKDLGVQNACFPLLIPLEFISREAKHVEGFAKECAVVTHHRLEQSPDGKGLIPAPAAKLEEPFVIRPTSETIIGDAMARWIQSYRDLPLKLNQWGNVMRWEMRTRMFLRTSEFLWHEGHNAFESYEGAEEDTLKMLDAYHDFLENIVAIPAIKGIKTPDERFPGADATYTMEAMMQDGKALQAATSHNLGQNFAKTFNIKFQDRNGQESYAHTTSWAFSSRVIGAIIMTHGDDDGVIMPPRVAPHQVCIIPVIRDESQAAELLNYSNKVKAQLKEKGIRVHIDDSENRTPDKMWRAIKKGVPIRVEIGGREMEEGTLTYIRRDLGKESKKTVGIAEFSASVQGLLDDMHEALLTRARNFMNERIFDVKDVAALNAFYSEGGIGFARINASLLNDEAFEAVKKQHGLTTRCLPLADGGGKAIIGKAY